MNAPQYAAPTASALKRGRSLDKPYVATIVRQQIAPPFNASRRLVETVAAVDFATRAEAVAFAQRRIDGWSQLAAGGAVVIVLPPPGSLDSRRSAPLGVRYFEQRDAAREMLAALISTRIAMEVYREGLTAIHSLMARDMDVDIHRMRAAIAVAEAAGITEGA